VILVVTIKETQEPNFAKNIIDIVAYKYIREGQEITINYNGQVDDISPVWFDVED
jgi:hypothetical protein